MLPRRKILAIVVALAGSGACQAQTTAEEDELALAYGDQGFVSIATGSRQPIRKAPAVATVITADDIAAMGATELDDVLESVPGVHVSRASVRYASTYFIRGVGAGGQANPQVLVMQNGIPVTTMFNGDKGAAWRGVPVENIARVEVIRGPGSALYGADAYAGVINIVTKTAGDAPGTEVGVRAGSWASRDGWLLHGGQMGPVSVAAFLRVGQTDGHRGRIASDAQTRNDLRFGSRASLAPGSMDTGYDAVDGSLDLAYGKWRLRGSYKLRDDLGSGVGVNSALVAESHSRNEVYSGDLSWTDPAFTRNWGLGFTASYMHHSFTFPGNLMLLPPGAKSGSQADQTFPDGMIGGPNQWERQTRLSAFASYAGFAGHALRFGLGHDDLDLYRTLTKKNYLLDAAGAHWTGPVIDYSGIQPFIRPQRRTISYLYVQDEWSLARDWTVTAGLRHDHYSDFGATTNPRLAVVWEAAYNLTGKLLYGEAFRAPSFNEQYGINPVANGNPGLRPESIRTLEAAFAWQPRRDTQLNLSLFRYSAADIIRLLGTAYQNAGSQHGRGLELEAAWDAGRNLRLSGNYAYQRAVDQATRQDPGYAPRHHVYARADWRFTPGWRLAAQVNHVADRKRAVGDTRPAVADYTTLDLSLRTDGSQPGWHFAFTARNLFAADAREPTLYSPAPATPANLPTSLIPDDLPLPGRSFWLQASYRL